MLIVERNTALVLHVGDAGARVVVHGPALISRLNLGGCVPFYARLLRKPCYGEPIQTKPLPISRPSYVTLAVCRAAAQVADSLSFPRGILAQGGTEGRTH